jgi:glycosyltransferase involved in cell wall biosynthesis
LDLSLTYRLPLFLVHGAIALIKWRRKHYTNYLYCYNGLDIENVFFVLVAKALGYHIVFDIVEDFSQSEDQPHFLARLKTSSWTCLDRSILTIADGIIVISQYLKSKYDDRKSRIPVQLIPISAKSHAVEDMGGDRSHRTVTFVYAGSFGEKDDVLTLVEAFENLHQRRRDSKLCLFGKGGQLEKVKVKIRGIPSVKYGGYLPDKEFYEVLRKADVLCMTRKHSAYAHAGFPFKLGEYLATGKPVIASKVGDVETYLRDGEDAFLVDPGDINALERAMEYCIDNYDVAARVGRSGMEKCKAFFNPDINGQLFVELMNKKLPTGAATCPYPSDGSLVGAITCHDGLISFDLKPL